MKILLINPPSEQELIGNNPAIIEEERGYNPPLGLLYIAAYLEAQGGHEITVIDAQVEELSYPQLAERIKAVSPDLVGLTAMTFTIFDVIHTIQLVKAQAPEARVVIGGPHAHLFQEETLNLPGVDFVVVGEGEEVFSQLVEHLHEPENLLKIRGLVFRHEGQIIKTGYAGMIQNLDSLPFPARHLVPYEKYTSLLARRSPITTMFTSRGCPFQCAFCDRPHLGKRFRARSPKNVVDEMEACVKMGIHEFLIYDDTFTVDRKRVLGICAEMRERKLDIGWDIRARVDTVDEALLREMRATGCERIHYGVEAGSEKILKVLNKNITLPQVRNAFAWTKKAGIETLAYFMIGSPTETREDIQQTIRFAQSLDPDYVHMTILTPFPGTKIYFDGLEQGVFDHDFWQEFAANPTTDFKPRYWEQELSTAELVATLNDAYKQFYLRPRYVWKRLTRVRSLAELARKAHAGLKVLRL